MKNIKGRLVTRGFQEQESPQSDYCTIMKKSLEIQIAIAANEGFSLRSIDIKATFLQAKGLDREVYLEGPRDAKKEGRIGKLKRPYMD